MIRPKPGSWEGVHPARGYHVVLLTAGNDAETTALVTGVRAWGESEHVRLETVNAATAAGFVDAIVEAIDRSPDVIICAGKTLVDALALVTASHLNQQFIVLGAQLPEPTVNVTAAVWRGASSRGGLTASVPFDPRAFTPRLVGDAVRASVAIVLSDITGIVIWLGP
jgi:hypothetical protein